MPTSFTFDSALNLDKCFRNTPPLNLEVNDLPKLPKDWLTKLEDQCRNVNMNLEKNIFSTHVGPKSKYKSKTQLLEQLSLIYSRISGNLDKQLGPLDSESSKLLILELIEDIQRCTGGFEIRVNKLVNSFHTVQNLDQLLYLVRKSIIKEIAASLTNQVGEIYQVHVANRVCQIAKKQGLGIEPDIQKDRYKSFLSGKSIRQHLKNEFTKHYTYFQIPFLLTTQLKLILSQHRYKGSQKTGYAIGPAEEMLETIQVFLSNPIKTYHNKFYPFFILDKPDEFGEPTRIFDINWFMIQSLFFQKLIFENYFIEQPEASNLLEYAYFQVSMPEKANFALETQLINSYLNKQDYMELIECLILIHDRFEDYWKKLIENPIITKHIGHFFKFLMHQSYNASNAQEIQKRLNHTYTLLFSQTQQFILQSIGTNPTKIKFNFLFKSVKYCPEITQHFLSHFFTTNRKNHPLFFELLAKQNSSGNNFLMFTGRYHAETTQLILDLISENIDCIEKEKILALFSTHNLDNWNLLSLAARHQPDAIPFILTFIKQYPLIFDIKNISDLFYQKNNQDWNFLQLLVCYQSEFHIQLCLEFIQEKLESSTDEPWLELFLNRHTGNFLRLAAQSNFNALNPILSFIDRYIDQLNQQTLAESFLQTYANGWNCLHLAARYNASNLLLILKFLEKHSKQFDASSLSDLFLVHNNNNSNFIQLATRYQPSSIDQIFKFISRNIKFFDKATLKELFLQQNSQGWTFLSTAYLHPTNIKIILDFINQHNNLFDSETIHQIILSKNQYADTCLHLSAQFQPDSLEIILNFIKLRIDLFVKSLNQLFKEDHWLSIPVFLGHARLFQNSFKPKNLLTLDLKHQPESTRLFLNFLYEHKHYFNLGNSVIKKFICRASKLVKSEHSTGCVGLFNRNLTHQRVEKALDLSNDHALTDYSNASNIRLVR